MQTVRFFVIFLVCTCVILTSGCGSELEACNRRNKTQQKLMDDFETKLGTTKVQLGKCQLGLEAAESKCRIKQDELQQKADRLREELTLKGTIIAKMQEQLLTGVSLPPELITLLEDFAAKNEMVTYDPSQGIVRFESDLLFKSGYADVLPAAEKAVKSLCGILNTEQAKGFDIIIAGHTDDQPIDVSRSRHPTNWHLSAHRAISVLTIMEASKINSERMSIRGFGEFRPAEPNKPDKAGNPKNRRVEIYIVPKGT